MPVMLFALLLFCAPVADAQEEAPNLGNAFIEAMDKGDNAAMTELAKTRAEEFPGEVQAMVEYAMSKDALPEETEFLFNVAGNMAKVYSDQTGDKRLLNAVMGTFQNYNDRKNASALSPEVVAATKKELEALGGGSWKVTVFKRESSGDLLVEIAVRESSGGEGFTPRIEFKQGQQAKEIVKKNLPDVKKGKISWSSMGVGLKVAFLDD